MMYEYVSCDGLDQEFERAIGLEVLTKSIVVASSNVNTTECSNERLDILTFV